MPDQAAGPANELWKTRFQKAHNLKTVAGIAKPERNPVDHRPDSAKATQWLDAPGDGSQVMAQQVSCRAAMGREQLSGFEGQSPISAQITQDRAMAWLPY